MTTDNIDWTDPEAQTVDGFTVYEIEEFVYDSVFTAVCTACGSTHSVEPDARAYTCHECETPGSVTSPLVKLHLI